MSLEPPRALRLAPSTRPRHDNRRDVELSRIFGGAVQTITLKTDDAREVGRIVREMKISAVLADSFRGDALDVRHEVHPIPVLRPMYERQPGYRDGPAPEKFVGYGQLNERGDVESLDDGALARSR